MGDDRARISRRRFAGMAGATLTAGLAPNSTPANAHERDFEALRHGGRLPRPNRDGRAAGRGLGRRRRAVVQRGQGPRRDWCEQGARHAHVGDQDRFRSGVLQQAPPTGLKELAGRTRQPLLLIAAPNSPNGEALNRGYARAAGDNATLWEIPEAGHVGGLDARPEEYERRVVGFFDEALR